MLDRIFLDAAEGEVTQAYWTFLLLQGHPDDARGFAKKLRTPPAEPSAPAARQFVEKVRELMDNRAAILDRESAMNDLLYALYDLPPNERELVERDRATRPVL